MQWRKTTGDLPRLLFAPQDRDVTVGPGGVVSSLSLRSTAAGVLETLTEQGLGWAQSVAAYASVRGGGYASAFLSGQYSAQEHRLRRSLSSTDDPLADGDDESSASDLELDRQVDEAVQARIDAESAATPEEDLRSLGALLAAVWQDEDRDVFLLDDLRWDTPVEVTTQVLLDAIRTAEEFDRLPLPVARAVETLMLLFRDARLVAWPIIICVLLTHLPPNSAVTYELSEGIGEFEAETAGSADAFLNEWWSSTGEGIATYTQTLGVLFGALSAFSTNLGTQFWLGRAISAHAHLQALNQDRALSSKKARGDALEHLAEAMFAAEDGVVVMQKNYKTEEEEIDLVLRNELTDPFWASHQSPFILVECKNWAERVGVKELRVLESKMQDRRGPVRIGIFISVSGFTKPFLQRLKAIQGLDVGVIYPVTGADLTDLVARRESIMQWVRTSGAVRSFGM